MGTSSACRSEEEACCRGRGELRILGLRSARSHSPTPRVSAVSLARCDGLEPGLKPSALPDSQRAEPESKREGCLCESVGSEALMLGFAQIFECMFEEEARKWTSKCLAMLRLCAEGEGENPTF